MTTALKPVMSLSFSDNSSVWKASDDFAKLFHPSCTSNSKSIFFDVSFSCKSCQTQVRITVHLKIISIGMWWGGLVGKDGKQPFTDYHCYFLL